MCNRHAPNASRMRFSLIRYKWLPDHGGEMLTRVASDRLCVPSPGRLQSVFTAPVAGRASEHGRDSNSSRTESQSHPWRSIEDISGTKAVEHAESLGRVATVALAVPGRATWPWMSTQLQACQLRYGYQPRS